jgi:hypothetical protein
MDYFDYGNVKSFVHDRGLWRLLCLDRNFSELIQYFTGDDFLKIDGRVKIPFFAETRDYVGAREKMDPESLWMVKEVGGKAVLQAEMASICYFLDFTAHTLSAPIVVTKIAEKTYKATKLMPRAEQLSGANYTERKQLKEQLLLDIVNRWIYFDEDRNPNNYMIKYNSRNDQILVAIDFCNVDLLSTEIKIKGTPGRFGWSRMEKTRYLTPLRSENCLEYDMDFFNIRFSHFLKIDETILHDICASALRFNSEQKKLAETISNNILKRILYLHEYFRSTIMAHAEDTQKDKYRAMGKTFSRLYSTGN